MESLPEVKMVELPSNLLEVVRKEYNLNNAILKEAIDNLEEWVKKQSHFVKRDFDRDYLERKIIAAKGSVEKAKLRMDKMCTLRTMNPHLFEDVDIVEDFASLFDNLSLAILPKLTNKYERVYLANSFGTGFSPRKFLDCFRYSLMLAEYTLAYDYSLGFHVISDFREANMGDLLMNTNLVDLRKTVTFMIEGFGLRVKGVHLLTESKWMDVLVTLCKQVVSEKIKNRIFVHKTLDSLHEMVEKDVLPSNYGGKEKTLVEINEEWTEVLSSKSARQYWREMCAAKSDESLRQTDKFNEQYMGMPGTFRTLSVD